MTGIVVAVAVIALPVLVFLAWPLVRRGDHGVLLPLPPDAREQLLEQKRGLLRALRELEFEHQAGHVSDDDYQGLRARYESETAALLGELDRLGAPREAPPPPGRRPAPVSGGSAWHHPVALGVGAVTMVVFGVALGVGIVKYTTPEPPATAMAGPGGMGGGGRPAMPGPVMPGAGEVASGPLAGAPAGGGPAQPLPPAVLQGMLQAARQALMAGQYTDAIAAYQAILRRDPRNVDAITHLGLIVAMGGHSDSALQTFDKALAIDPNYPPALLYRGQVLYEAKGDPGGAIKSWEKFLAVAPPGEDRERVQNLIAQARSTPAPKPR